MGEVYRAKDTRLDRDVAVKVLPAGSVGNADAEARFDREARAIAALNHPHICALYDVGHDEGRSFLVMELLEGETLHQRLTRGPLEISALVDHAIALADALDTAHARGMLHRDLKPANLFLTSRGQIKILDFGLTKAIESSDGATRVADGLLTGMGTAVGTMGYMSPEQLRGEAIDARSDLFALGVVLYEMATGERAFQGSAGAVVSAAILTEHPVAPRTRRPDLPLKLEETILKALEKDRDVRCHSAGELRADLKRVKRDLPANAAAPPSAPGVAPRTTPAAPMSQAASSDTQLVVGLVKRHRLAALLTIVLLAGVIAGAYWLSQRQTAASTTASSATAPQIQPLTATGNAARGALSPDGKFVAYVRREGRDNADFSLWVRQLATHSDVQIIPAVPGRQFIGVVVTPDSSYVDFVAAENDVTRPDLWRVPFLGGTPRRISREVVSSTGWAPDGRHMAFIRTKAGGGEDSVVIADADGANERVLITRRNPVRFLNASDGAFSSARPSWSTDGRLLLVLGRSRLPERQGRADELVVIDITTGAETKTVPLAEISTLYEASWLDASHALVSGMALGQPPGIHRVDLVTGALAAPVTQAMRAFFGVSLTADRQAAVTTLGENRTGLWVGDAAGGSMMEIVPEAPGPGMEVSLDGAGGLVYSALTPTGMGIFAIGPGQRAPLRVVDSGRDPKITRDGKAIVFRRDVSFGKAGLFRVNVDGSGLTTLVDGDASDAHILPDGRTVVYIAPDPSGVHVLWSVPLAGGPSRQILQRFVDSGSLSVSPDGRKLRFSSGVVNGRVVSQVCDLPDCTNPRDFNVRPGQWTPDGRGIAFRDSTDTRNIWVQPIDGGAPRPLTKFTEKQMEGFTWSADGTRLAIVRGTVLFDIVLIKGIR